MSGTVGTHPNFEKHLNNEMLDYVFRYNKTFDSQRDREKTEGVFLIIILKAL
jgi:hypothetical protein